MLFNAQRERLRRRGRRPRPLPGRQRRSPGRWTAPRPQMARHGRVRAGRRRHRRGPAALNVHRRRSTAARPSARGPAVEENLARAASMASLPAPRRARRPQWPRASIRQAFAECRILHGGSVRRRRRSLSGDECGSLDLIKLPADVSDGRGRAHVRAGRRAACARPTPRCLLNGLVDRSPWDGGRGSASMNVRNTPTSRPASVEAAVQAAVAAEGFDPATGRRGRPRRRRGRATRSRTGTVAVRRRHVHTGACRPSSPVRACTTSRACRTPPCTWASD